MNYQAAIHNRFIPCFETLIKKIKFMNENVVYAQSYADLEKYGRVFEFVGNDGDIFTVLIGEAQKRTTKSKKVHVI